MGWRLRQGMLGLSDRFDEGFEEEEGFRQRVGAWIAQRFRRGMLGLFDGFNDRKEDLCLDPSLLFLNVRLIFSTSQLITTRIDYMHFSSNFVLVLER
jgi:hypothetical protein